MYPHYPNRRTDPSAAPPVADRSLASTLGTTVLTTVAFAAAFLTATTAATIVPGPPLVAASIVLVVGVATALAVPIGASWLGRRLLAVRRRRGRRRTPSEPNRPEPRPTKG